MIEWKKKLHSECILVYICNIYWWTGPAGRGNIFFKTLKLKSTVYSIHEYFSSINDHKNKMVYMYFYHFFVVFVLMRTCVPDFRLLHVFDIGDKILPTDIILITWRLFWSLILLHCLFWSLLHMYIIAVLLYCLWQIFNANNKDGSSLFFFSIAIHGNLAHHSRQLNKI